VPLWTTTCGNGDVANDVVKYAWWIGFVTFTSVTAPKTASAAAR